VITWLLQTPTSPFQPLSLQDVLCIVLPPDRLPMPSYAAQGGECLPGHTPSPSQIACPIRRMSLIMIFPSENRRSVLPLSYVSPEKISCFYLSFHDYNREFSLLRYKISPNYTLQMSADFCLDKYLCFCHLPCLLSSWLFGQDSLRLFCPASVEKFINKRRLNHTFISL